MPENQEVVVEVEEGDEEETVEDVEREFMLLVNDDRIKIQHHQDSRFPLQLQVLTKILMKIRERSE